MKKIFASLLILAATTTAFAQAFSAKATLTLKSENGKVSTLTIVQSDDATLKEYNSVLNMENRSIALYAYDEATDKQYEVYVIDDFSKLNIGVITNDETNYTVTVTDITGNLYINNKAVKDGDVIPFTFDNNKLKAFAVSTVAPEPGICHQNGRLEITGYKDWNVQVVNYETGDDALNGAVTIAEDYQDIPLDIDEGQYKVIMTKGEDKKELVIKVVK